MKNKKNNKGFSLVELIIVVAIMAVLVGILAPAYLKYVEKSRVSKDQANADEFVSAVEVAITDETIYEKMVFGTAAGATDIVITIADDAAIAVTGGTCAELVDEVEATVAEKLLLTSKKYNGGKLEITIDCDDLKVSSKLLDKNGNQ